jgi:hypothetical protein
MVGFFDQPYFDLCMTDAFGTAFGPVHQPAFVCFRIQPDHIGFEQVHFPPIGHANLKIEIYIFDFNDLLHLPLKINVFFSKNMHRLGC